MINPEEALAISRDGPVLRLTLNRPDKRNALNDAIASAFERVLADPGPEVRVIVLDAVGPGFCGGIDLKEHREREPFDVLMISRRWHRIKDMLQYGKVPVIAAMHGAVIGGGFELVAAAHVRVADTTTYFQLPEARRGFFIGGGGSVRISRIVGQGRITELMLTGRRLEAAEAERIGVVHRLVDPGAALETALETARTVAENAPVVNYLIVQALPRIADMSAQDGLFTESLAASLSHVSQSARDGIDAFFSRTTAADQGAATPSPESDERH